MPVELDSALLLALCGLTLGCIKYVHDQTAKVYKTQAKFMEGWNAWRLVIAERLATIEAVLKIRDEG